MRTETSIAGVRSALREAPRPVGLVPTMGALHEGHASLIRRARAECATVVASLFVNPAQFGPGEDLAAYPRDEAGDAALAEREGVDLLFAPPVAELYPPGFSTTVAVGGLTEVLDGDPERRGSGHFHGVTTVVTKLLNITRADRAYFGQKDAQQALTIRRLVRDLDLEVDVEVLPTVREPDGLALSSRNAYLAPDERSRALALSAALRAAERAVAAGERQDGPILAAARAELTDAGVEPEYIELRSPDDLAAVTEVDGATLLLVAARVGRARLIDNVTLTTGGSA